VAVSDANGQIEARMAFDAWGQRRDPWSDAAWLQWTDLRPVWADAMLAITPRGFTGHEHLDRHGLIHMNGRVYDPRLGRFLQADPFIEDTSTLNRYTYVLNNPLSYSDPSGYFSFKDFARLAFSVTLSFYTQTWVTQLAELGNYAGAIGTVAASGAVAGGVNSGTWDGALSGAFTAVASFGIGQGLEAGRFAGNFAGSELSPAGFALKIGAHGVVGGVAAELQGGKFGHGFLSSGVTAAFSPAIHNPDGNTLMQTALAAMIGGTVSEISGGSFANGAVTSAMAFAFNQMTQVPEAEAYEEHSSGRTRMTFVEPDYSVEPKISWLGVEDLDWLMIADASLAGPLLRTRIPLPDLQIATERGEYLYLHRFKEYEVQWIDRGPGKRFDRRILDGPFETGREPVWRPIPEHTNPATRLRIRSCFVEGGCVRIK